MRRSIPLAITALSLGSSTVLVPAQALAATTYKGAFYSEQWGGAQVSIQVKGKKISAISAAVQQDTQHSIQLDAYAIPELKQEALKSNSYKIHVVSGATQTSEAFIDSLKSALGKAHI